MTRGWAAAIAIAASVGAGMIHLALGPEHLEELGALGWGFYLAAALQAGWAVAVVALLGRSGGASRFRWPAIAGIAINVAILGAWAISRTAGLPAGETPWLPEPIGRTDTIAAALEVAIVAAILVQRRPRPALEFRRARLATALAFVVIATGTAAGLAPDTQHAAAHDTAHDAAHDVMTEARIVIVGEAPGDAAEHTVGHEVDPVHDEGEQPHTH